MDNFKHIHKITVPSHWERYFTKYPNGYSILESFMEIVSKFNALLEEYEEIGDFVEETKEELFKELNDFLNRFDKNLENEVDDLLSEWLDNGILEEIIEKTLDTQVDEMEERFFNESPVVHKSQPNGMVTWIDDDGQSGFYDKLAPIAKEFGVPMASAIIVSRIGDSGYMKEHEIRELNDDDSGLFEFISHTYDGHSQSDKTTGWNTEDYRADLKRSVDYLKENRMSYKYFAIPFGSTSERNKKVESEFFEASFHTAPLKNYVENPVDQYKINRLSVEDKLKDIQDVLTEASENNRWVVIMSHIDQYDVTEEKVEDIIQHALNVGLEFVDIEKGLKHFGNVVQAENFSINANHKAYGTIVKGYTTSDYNPDGKLEEFPAQTSVAIKIKTDERKEYDLPDYGILEVYRDSESTYSYQKFYSLREGNHYFRKWDNSLDDWTEWRQNTAGFVRNEAFEDTDPDDLPKNRLMFYKVRASERDEYSDYFEQQGVVISFRGNEDAYVFQEFIPYRAFYKKSRYRDIDGNWSSWRITTPGPVREYTRTISKETTIKSFSTSSFSFEPGNDFYSYITYKLDKKLPSGLMVTTHMRSDEKGEIVIANVTDSDIELSSDLKITLFGHYYAPVKPE